MEAVGRLSGVALECREPAVLAEFYSRLTGWPIVHRDVDWYSVGADADADFHLSFQFAPGHQPPTWPDPSSSMQSHVHVRVDDIEKAEEVVLALGATKSTTSRTRSTHESLPIRQVIRSACVDDLPRSGMAAAHSRRRRAWAGPWTVYSSTPNGSGNMIGSPNGTSPRDRRTQRVV